MTDAEKRVAIAKDVLEQVAADSIVPFLSGAFVEPVHFDDQRCYACAVGALAVAQLRARGSMPRLEVSFRALVDALAPAFGREQLILIELAFESGGGAIAIVDDKPENLGANDVTPSDDVCRAADMFHANEPADHRLVAIMCGRGRAGPGARRHRRHCAHRGVRAGLGNPALHHRGGRVMRWSVSNRADPPAVRLSDRHYNRQKVGSSQFVPPGRCVVLLTPDADALWVTSWPFAEYAHHAWAGAWVNSLFRNESAHLSSALIVDAVAATRALFGEPPPLGIVTFIDEGAVRRKRDPGRCYLRAGWSYARAADGARARTKERGLIVLQLLPAAMPAAAMPMRGQPSIFDLGGAP